MGPLLLGCRYEDGGRRSLLPMRALAAQVASDSQTELDLSPAPTQCSSPPRNGCNGLHAAADADESVSESEEKKKRRKKKRR